MKNLKRLTVILCVSLIAAFTAVFVAACDGTQNNNPDAVYSVTILDADGTQLHKTEGKTGTSVEFAPERTGYKFGGYYSDDSLSSSVDFSGVVGSSDTVLYTKWIANRYTIRFDGDRAYGSMSDISVAYDEKIKLPENSFVLRGESFEEWQYQSSDGKQVSVADKATVRNLSEEDGAVIVLKAIFDNYDSQNFVVENGVAVAYNGSSENVRLPQTATVVSAGLFENCAAASEIKKLEVPSCYTRIENGAFKSLTSLAELKVPFIGGSAESNSFLAYVFGAEKYTDNVFSFQAEISLYSLVEVNPDYSKLVIPRTLKKVVVTEPVYAIPEGAFYFAYSLEKVVILQADELYQVGDSAFEGCINLGYDSVLDIENPLNWLESVENIGNKAFSAYISEENDEGSSYIFSRLFRLPALENIVRIEDEAFYGCVYLNNVEFGDSLQSIGAFAFVNCSSLTSVKIPDSTTVIGDRAFYGCGGLTQAEIGREVQTIGDFAFAGCKALAEITFNGDIPAGVSRIPFSHGVDYTFNDQGLITDFAPVFDESVGLVLYVNETAVADYKSAWGDYARFVDTKGDTQVFYWGENSDGSFATKFEVRGGKIAYVTDTALEFLNTIDMFSEFYNSFRAGIKDDKYTMFIQEEEVPQGVARGEERFFIISNPNIVDALGAKQTFRICVRPVRIEIDGTVYFVPVFEQADYYFPTLGKGGDSLAKIERDDYGHFTLYQRNDSSSDFSEYAPVGAVYSEYNLYYILGYTEKMVGIDWYDGNGVFLENKKFFVANDCLYPIQNNDELTVCYTDYPTQIILDGNGSVLLSAFVSKDNSEYIGSYTIAEGQKFGDAVLDISLVNLKGVGATYNGTLKLEGFFGEMYHKCTLRVSSENDFIDKTLYVSYDLETTKLCYSEDETEYYLFYGYSDGENTANFVQSYKNGITSNGTYSIDGDEITILMPNSNPVKGYIDDVRGSFHISQKLGDDKKFLAYEDWENANFYMEENFLGTVLTYYIVKMDGYGNAMFYDGHDDDFDDWYKGTYYNTGESIGGDANGSYDVYYFEGVECDKSGRIIPNGKTFKAYYVTDSIVYDDEDEDGGYTYSGNLLSVTMTTESRSFEVFDESGQKFADLNVSPFGVATLTIYDTVFENGEFVSVKNEELTAGIKAVAYTTASGSLAYVVAYDLADNYLFRISLNENEDWIYEYEGEIVIRKPVDTKIYPDVDYLTEAE